MNKIKELLYLHYTPGIGRALVNAYAAWRRTCTAAEASGQDPYGTADRWLQSSGRRPDSHARERAEKAVAWLSAHPETHIVTILDNEYPAQLNVMDRQRPPFLFVSGRVSRQTQERGTPAGGLMQYLSSGPCMAVIGSRWPCSYTIEHAAEFVRGLVRIMDMPVISGLARGCDRAGHSAAMECGVPTIAVMPCGPDQIVPEINRDIAEQILDGRGCLVTEYPPGTPPAEYRYVERDRVVAALSDAAVVLDCQVKSGTMQTVRASASYGRFTACWHPDGAEQDGFQGNRYMMQTYHSVPLNDSTSIQNFAERIRAHHAGVVNGGHVPARQLSFL